MSDIKRNESRVWNTLHPPRCTGDRRRHQGHHRVERQWRLDRNHRPSGFRERASRNPIRQTPGPNPGPRVRIHREWGHLPLHPRRIRSTNRSRILFRRKGPGEFQPEKSIAGCSRQRSWRLAFSIRLHGNSFYDLWFGSDCAALHALVCSHFGRKNTRSPSLLTTASVTQSAVRSRWLHTGKRSIDLSCMSRKTGSVCNCLTVQTPHG